MSEACARPRFSAIVPTHARFDLLARTLDRLLACEPAPDEILVHVDAGNAVLRDAVTAHYPQVRCLFAETRLGPGGARNRLLAAATHDWVASFDDDSYPAQGDWFARAAELVRAFPGVAVFSAASHAPEWASLQLRRIAVFSGCGCIFHKPWFLRTCGFVPLAVAYGMEEVDLSLQLHALGGRIIHDPLLRVNHEPAPDRPAPGQRTAELGLVNTLMLPWLRYPVALWPVGLLQGFSKIRWMLAHGQGGSVLPGLRLVPDLLLEHRAQVRRVPVRCLLSWLRLRRRTEDLGDARALAHGFSAGDVSELPASPCQP
jgi:GT2 family glycosyltransferase